MKITRLLSPLDPRVPIGYLPSGRPVYPVFGGADDLDVEPDVEDEDEPEEEEAEPEDEGGKKGKYTPPDRAEWVRVQASLAKANASAKQRREALADRDKRIAELEAKEAEAEVAKERKALQDQRAKGKAKGGGGGVAPDLPDSVMTKAQVRQATQAAAKEAEDRAAEKYRGMAVSSAARAALISEGVDKAAASRLVRLLDTDEIELDPDSGEVTGGLDEQMDKLKEEMPQLFRQAEPEVKPKRRPAPRATPAPQQEAQERPRSTAEQMAAMVLGSR